MVWIEIILFLVAGAIYLIMNHAVIFWAVVLPLFVIFLLCYIGWLLK